jgi:hypothetical protein
MDQYQNMAKKKIYKRRTNLKPKQSKIKIKDGGDANQQRKKKETAS